MAFFAVDRFHFTNLSSLTVRSTVDFYLYLRPVQYLSRTKPFSSRVWGHPWSSVWMSLLSLLRSRLIESLLTELVIALVGCIPDYLCHRRFCRIDDFRGRTGCSYTRAGVFPGLTGSSG